MPTRKTFAADEILTAADVNTYLNPETSATIPARFAAGQASIPSAAATSSTVTVTFPTNRFDVAPIVIVIPYSGPVLGNRQIRVTSRTATQAVLAVHTSDGANITTAQTVYWIAVQMTGTAAEG